MGQVIIKTLNRKEKAGLVFNINKKKSDKNPLNKTCNMA